MPGPLDGVKVVELGVWVAGPAAAGILADWGADVVKIEPPSGDPARRFGTMLGLDIDVNPPFELDNRSKRSVVLDLTADEDRRRGLEMIVPGRRFRDQPSSRCIAPTRIRLRVIGARPPAARLWADHRLRRDRAGRRPRRL